MPRTLTLMLVIALAAGVAHAAGATVTAHRIPPKPPATVPANIPDPTRQGGDTVADATVVPALPFGDTGTTTGFADDYDEVCPFTGSTSPDVVYEYVPPADMLIAIDLCGSSYDTKLYVYDEQLNVVACNDDAYSWDDPCGNYVSALDYVELSAGGTYYIVIDGWEGDHGDYVLDVAEFVPCVLECPTGGVPEGEPPLVDNYVDSYNGGCNSPEFGVPFQELDGDEQGQLVLCGVAGWYLYNGSNYRDTDWFHLYAGPTGTVELTADAECPVYIIELGPQDCSSPAWIQDLAVGGCEPGSMTMSGYSPGQVIWLWVGSTTFAAPYPGYDNEFDYILSFSGLMPATVATEPASWTTVKTLFR